ncbi:hypothetical protein [Sphaerisporangium sp. NPDC051011]|uniref:hypothetical protein n=1 Tax=Sphaerisporangium sp. NPDC051011 TaxID=3155792 RepID=UPI0033C555E0
MSEYDQQKDGDRAAAENAEQEAAQRTEPTTIDQLYRKYREARDGALAGRDDLARALDDALDLADLDIIPRVWGDDRHWRIVLDGQALPAVADAEAVAHELVFALIGHPVAEVALRPADPQEVRAFALRGGEGLAELDRRRAEHDLAIAHETAAAITAALEAQP